MLQQIIILSLIETSIWVSGQEGMIFSRVFTRLKRLRFFSISFVRKPLFDCLPCMGGFYTLLLYPLLFGLSWQVVPVMLCCIGLNSIIAQHV